MKRRVAAGLLAICAGCGPSHAMRGEASKMGPVGLSPLPSIHEQINGDLPPQASEVPELAESEIPGLQTARPDETRRELASTSAVSDPAALEALPPLQSETPAGSVPALGASGPVASMPVPANPPVDPQVVATSLPAEATPESDETAQDMAIAAELPTGQPVGEWAARVNEDIITWNELQGAVRLRLRDLPPEQQREPQVREIIIISILDRLIDRTLILQHARRNELKNPKAWDFFTKEADKAWEREKLPILLKQVQANDIYELERKLRERNESLEELRDAYRQDFISRQYLIMKVAPKIHVDLPEMRVYYHENRLHDQFARAEQMTWSEICVETKNHPDRATALVKAEQALARLRRGEDFAVVARELSEGPNAQSGGVWEKTTPGSYAVQSVNQTLASLPPGQVSGILEGPESYHIVRLESHTPAGILSFPEVQTRIRDIIRQEKETKEMDRYLEDLYRGAVISTVFKEYRPRDQRAAAP